MCHITKMIYMRFTLLHYKLRKTSKVFSVTKASVVPKKFDGYRFSFNVHFLQ